MIFIILMQQQLLVSGQKTKKVSLPKTSKSHEKLKKITNTMENQIRAIDQLNHKLNFNKPMKAHYDSKTYEKQLPEKGQTKDFAEITFGRNEFLPNPEKQVKNFDIVRKRSPDEIFKELQVSRRRKDYAKIVKRPHHPSEKIESTIQRQIRQDKEKNPKKYIIMCGEIGLTEQEVFKMKGINLNCQLQKFGRNKGHQYLKEAKYKGRSTSERHLEKMKTQPANSLYEHEKSSEEYKRSTDERIKYPNYIPQIFSGLKAKKAEKKLSEISVPVTLQKDKAKDPKIKKHEKLIDKEEVLGKIVLEKVKKHMKNERQQKKDYFSRVKSEENIDDTLIEYLKTKVDRADLLLEKK